MRSLVKFLLRLARCSSGNALIEMTIVVPVAISIAAGGVDFGMALTTHATAGKSVRDAARYLGNLRASECNDQISNAQNIAVYGNLIGAGSPLIPNWNANGGPNNNVNITCGSTIVVSAKIPYDFIFLTSFLPIGTLTLSTQHEEPQLGGS
jgi:Flp pilus assembly protein TadG